MQNVLKNLSKVIHHFEGGLLVIALFSMIALAVVQIIMRNTMGTGIVWSEAVVRILVLWVAFLGAMIGSRRGEHISIELVSHYVDSQWKRPVQRTVAIVSASLCFIASWVSFQFVMLEYQEQTMAFAGVPAWLCQVILPIGFFIIGSRFLLSTLNNQQQGAAS